MTLTIAAAATGLQIEGIIAAAITGSCALAGLILQSRKTRRINTEEHNFNATTLDQIETKLDKVVYRIDRVPGKLEDHLDEHKKQSP